MRLREKRRPLLSLVAVGIFIFSMIFAGTAAPITQVSSDSSIIYSYNTSLPAQSTEDSGTWVNWQQESNATSDEWTWESKNWLFGPSPSFEIFHENGTLLTADSYAEINEIINFVVTVPKDILQGADIGAVRFYGWYMTTNWNFSASFDFSYQNWEYTYQPWNAYSWQYNNSGEYGPPLPSFVDILPNDCSNTTDAHNYYFAFAVRFTEDTPLGLYQLNMNIEDSEHNYIGSYNFGSGYEFQGIAVGIHPDLAWSYSYGGSYTLQKLDMGGDNLYSVSRLTDFKMRFNITGDNPEYVQLGFNTPGSMQIPVNRTGWHQEIRTSPGGWVYDDTLQTYVYDELIEVTSLVDVYGTFQSYEWTDLGLYQEVNVTYLYQEWNGETWEYNLIEQEQWVSKKMFYLYNFTSAAFEEYYGYQYYGYPYETYIEGTWNEEVTVYEPIPQDFPIFYELNHGASQVQDLGKEIVVDFVGYFTELMPKTNQYSYFSFQTRVMGEDYEFYPDTYGERPRQTQQEFELARSITIESPVTIAKILNADGTAPNGWMFQVDQEEQFMVRGRLQGGSSIADDIDGVSFYLEAYDSFWSEDYYRWSNLQFIIEVEVDGSETLKAYNMTQMNNYTYGTYMDYILVNQTGWYYAYNESTNTWQWVYGEYQEWQWAETEGWHWQNWYFNQITQQWQKEWIAYRSAETVVPGTFGTVSSYTNWTDGGDFIATFLFTPDTNMPETNYWWDFAFMNRTWFEDSSSGWGEHEVEDWGLEWVHSFIYEPTGDRVYVDSWNENQLSYDFQNGTLAGEIALGVETPYIIIDGDKLPIKVRENYDPWSGYVWKTMFFYDHYDPATGREVYYYELTNGTKVYVTYVETIVIYNVTTSGGDSFLTAQDYHHYVYDGTTEYAYWIDIDGVMHYGSYSEYGRHQLAYFGIHDQVEKTLNQPWMGYVIYGTSMTYLEIVNFWWESRDSSYYMTTSGGTLLPFKWNSGTGFYETYIGGAWQICTWPERYYVEEYLGVDRILPTYDVSRFWFSEVGGIEYEMPYPNAHAQWSWELDETEFDGGKVPTTKSLVWDGISYPVRNTSTYDWVKISGEVMEVWETSHSYVRANNTDSWDPDRNGYSGYVGTYDDDLGFMKLEQITYNNVTDNRYPYYDGSARYIFLNNGTTWVVNDTYLFTVFEYDLDGKSFFSTQEWPAYFESGNASWYEYKAVNGTMYQFNEWARPPILSTITVHTYYNGSGYSGHYFTFQSEEYEFSYEGRYVRSYWVDNATHGGSLFFYWENYDSSVKPILQFDYRGEYVEAIAHNQNVLRQRYRWGYALVNGLKEIESTVYKNFYDFVIGTPQWGMWGIKNWAINEDNGALDLDGDFDTTDDQYYIQEEYGSTNSWTHEFSKMWVNLYWDPNTTLYGDDMNIWSWLGLDEYTWSYEWNQTFYWYDANDFSQLTSAEMQDVIDTLISPEGNPMPGYWDIAWMAENVTWQDIIDEAIANGWDWIASNEQTWTWLSFGVSQNYGTSYVEGDVDHWLNIGMHYEFSGLMVWEDENDDSLMQVDLTNPGSGELTHYLMPDSVDSVSFVTPGAAYGDFNANGNMARDIEDEITWGVNFYDVNGTVFPFTTYGYWGWYDSALSGSDLRTFDERPTKVTVDELSFLVHFQGHLNTEPDAVNNYAEIKVDNYVGNWDVDMTGGRSNLVNRSLALNYFADVQMSDFAFKANGSFTDGESTVGSDVFEFETAGAQFAEMIMGGVTYDWGKNTTAPYDVTAMTTPVGTFRQAFESESGQSAVGWSSSSSMFYVTIGFPYWEGYSVMQDPVFISYTSSRGTSAPVGAVTFGAFSISPTVPQDGESVTVSVDIMSQMPINQVILEYSTDLASWQETSMWNSGGNRYSGDIPGYPDGTTVYFRVQVETGGQWTTSSLGSYIVGSGMVTTGTTGPTGPGGFEGLPTEILVMVAGVAVVLIIVLVLVKRRK